MSALLSYGAFIYAIVRICMGFTPIDAILVLAGILAGYWYSTRPLPTMDEM